MSDTTDLPPYPRSLAGTLLAAREAVMAPIRPLLREAGVTRIVRELVDRGLLSRATSESDRRRSVIEITPVGRELVGRTAARTARMLVAYGEAFGPERLDRFVLEAAALAAALSRFAPSDAGEGGSDEG